MSAAIEAEEQSSVDRVFPVRRPAPSRLAPCGFHVRPTRKAWLLASLCLALPILSPQGAIESDPGAPGSAGGWLPGDANGDGSRDIADPIYLLVHLFVGGPAPPCEKSANSNGDGKLDVADAIHILDYLFRGGGPPVIPVVECLRAEQCADREWLVDCLGHWTCDCGVCRPTCDFEGCGDGKCDWAGGETPRTCPGDCKVAQCPPACLHIGTRSEGWYDPCTGERYRWEQCAERTAVCLHCGSKGEGWYDSVTGELIAWGDCDCE